METMNNILLVGNSGAGKSTLIKCIFDDNDIETGKFGGGNTQKVKAYENKELNYRAIDTKGLELGFFAQRDAINQVNKYLKKIIKNGETDAAIDVIWYCVDSTGKRFFKENVNQILNIYKKLPDIPVVIVLTKSYCSGEERTDNEVLVNDALNSYDTKNIIQLCDVVSVNSVPFKTANDNVVEILGIDRLLDVTNEVLPQAKKISEKNMAEGRLKLKLKQAKMMTYAYASGASVIGAVPIPIADAMILVPLQTTMIKTITKHYNVESSVVKTAVIDGAVTTSTAKLVISAIKAIPGINIVASVLNAVVAAVFTVAVGEITIYMCDKYCRNEVKDENGEEMKELVALKMAEYMKSILPQLEKVIKNIDGDKFDKKSVKDIIEALLKGDKK